MSEISENLEYKNEEEFCTDCDYAPDCEPATMSECTMFLVQHMIDDELVSS